MMTQGDTIDVQDLPAYLHQPSVHIAGEGSAAEAAASIEKGGTLEEQERVLIVRALEASGGNQSQAARILRIGRDALRYKLKKHGLEKHADSTHSERGTATAE
jgi:DNA-binding NtrC family response regulator